MDLKTTRKTDRKQPENIKEEIVVSLKMVIYQERLTHNFESYLRQREVSFKQTSRKGIIEHIGSDKEGYWKAKRYALICIYMDIDAKNLIHTFRIPYFCLPFLRLSKTY